MYMQDSPGWFDTRLLQVIYIQYEMFVKCVSPHIRNSILKHNSNKMHNLYQRNINKKTMNEGA